MDAGDCWLFTPPPTFSPSVFLWNIYDWAKIGAVFVYAVPLVMCKQLYWVEWNVCNAVTIRSKCHDCFYAYIYICALKTPFLAFLMSLTSLWPCSTWSASLQPRRSLPEQAEGGMRWVGRLCLDWSGEGCTLQESLVHCGVVMSPFMTTTAGSRRGKKRQDRRAQGLLHSKLDLLTTRLLTYTGCFSPHHTNS